MSKYAISNYENEPKLFYLAVKVAGYDDQYDAVITRVSQREIDEIITPIASILSTTFNNIPCNTGEQNEVAVAAFANHQELLAAFVNYCTYGEYDFYRVESLGYVRVEQVVDLL